jgi:hypothetical protein
MTTACPERDNTTCNETVDEQYTKIIGIAISELAEIPYKDINIRFYYT